MDESILVLLVFVGIALLAVTIHIIVYIKKIRPLRKPYLEERKKEKKEEKERKKRKKERNKEAKKRKKATKIKHNLSEEQEIEALFTASYLSLFKRIHTRFESASMELLPYLYVVFDIAAIDSGYDRYKMKDIMLGFINKLLKDEEKSGQDDEEIEQVISWIYSRVDIYGKVVRGYKPKGMMFVTDKSLVNNDNAICRCTVMLSDILLNDDFSTVEEYEELPFIVCDIFTATSGAALMSEVAIASVKSHNMVYEIVKRR